jgi:hypothetical protein
VSSPGRKKGIFGLDPANRVAKVVLKRLGASESDRCYEPEGMSAAVRFPAKTTKHTETLDHETVIERNELQARIDGETACASVKTSGPT